MFDAEERIREYEEIIWLTYYKVYDLTNRWARIGVQSQAMVDSSYLKRRVVALWPYRHGNIIGKAENRDKIHRAIKYLRRLKVVCNAEPDGGMIV